VVSHGRVQPRRWHPSRSVPADRGQTTSPVLVTGVAAAGQLPRLLFGLVAGVLADRVNRRALVLAMDIVRTVLLAGLVALIATGHATIWVVYVVVFAPGLASVLRDTTGGTLVASIPVVLQPRPPVAPERHGRP